MTPKAALQFLDAILSKVNTDRVTTFKIVEAINVINKAIDETSNKQENKIASDS